MEVRSRPPTGSDDQPPPGPCAQGGFPPQTDCPHLLSRAGNINLILLPAFSSSGGGPVTYEQAYESAPFGAQLASTKRPSELRRDYSPRASVNFLLRELTQEADLTGPPHCRPPGLSQAQTCELEVRVLEGVHLQHWWFS